LDFYNKKIHDLDSRGWTINVTWQLFYGEQ